MVSNAVRKSQDEVVEALQRLRASHSGDAEYQNLRKDLPKEWPI